MILLCPICHHPLLSDGVTCAQGHRFTLANGVLSLVTASFAQRLGHFNTVLQRFRQNTGRRLLDPAVYEELPFSAAVRSNFEWRLRQYDWAVVQQWVGTRPRRILDIGAWNGWLSHRLTQLGHEVTAIDYFTDPYDGLGANRFYRGTWRSIQMDLTDLSPLPAVFDVIILNRCLAFFANAAAYVTQAQARLAPGGSLLLTGLALYRDPRSKAQAVATATKNYRQEYGTDLFLHPTKGYLDSHDQAELQAMGVQISPYRQLWAANLKAWLRPRYPHYAYGRLR